MIGTFLFISGQEIFIVLLLVVMLFGANKIPEIARGLGKGMREIKDATNNVKQEISENVKKQGVDMDVAKDVKKEIGDAKENLDDITGSIKRNI